MFRTLPIPTLWRSSAPALTLPPPGRLDRSRPTLRQRFRDPGTRRVFAVVLAGKLLGVLSLLAIIKALSSIFGAEAGASGLSPAAVDAGEIINPINTLWVMIAAFLVFFMQAGFMALEAGVARSRETVNVLMECVFDTCLCGLLFWAVGFAFMFGEGNGLIGHQYFFLNGATGGYGTTGVAFLAFFVFQLAFADAASTITSGAMVGRTSFKGDILYSIAVSGLIYPIFGHWVWGPGGWLGNTMGWFSGLVPDGIVFRDFAGSTVVHSVGGIVALAGAVCLGPRLGRRFARDGGGLFPPHDLVMASIGAVILWFGWYGFNPGSTLSAMDWEGIGRVAANTTLAACAGGMVAVFFVYPRSGKWDLGMSLNGFLGGLVATVTAWNANTTGADPHDPAFGRGASAYDGYWGDPDAASPAAQTLGPLDTAPYYAVPVAIGAMGTKGGPRTDGEGRVRHVTGPVIPGLYAAGNAMAGVTGRAYGGAGGTIGPAMVFGFRAGHHAATGTPAPLT